jgi:hypothetical protein
MAKNSLLGAAKVAKKDEFYTQLSDIEKELVHYREYFRDKIVFCNCDDPYESNFFKYFALNFNALGLKKLIATCYDGSPIAQQELPLFPIDESEPKRKAYKVEISEVPDMDGNGATDLTDVKLLLKSSNHNVKAELKGNGDFRSEECIELLKQADVVVTNPPFSLFREYVAILVKYNKKFIIIGNQNAVTYKEIFPMIKENKLWFGASIHSGDREFRVPNEYETRSASLRIDSDGNKYLRVPGVRWFTNVDYSQRHEDIILIKKYDPDVYPRYDNYDAINVNVTNDIPCDFEGIMGVPITFLDKYNPDQFEIIGGSNFEDTPCRIERNYRALGYRFLKSDGITESGSGALRDRTSPKVKIRGNSDYSVSPTGEYLSATYFRIFIRNKKPQIS